MRRVMFLVALAFAVTLAAVVGNRMSTEAMAVVVGVVCGVAAGIPMSMLLLFVFNRRDRQREDVPYAPTGGRFGSYPPVVVIQGGSAAPGQLMPPFYSAPASMQEAAQREFRIVGDDAD